MDTKKLRQKILDLAIHGKLVPQDPNDEPASVLLERIKAEKEQLIKEGKIKRQKKSASSDTSHYGNNVPFEIPEGWVWISGKDLFLPMRSTSPSGEKFSYIDIDAIDNKKNIAYPKIILTESAPSRASRYTQYGDTLFSMVRPYLKNIAKVQTEHCIASTGFYICHPYSDINADFIFYMMTSDYVVDGLNSFIKGDNSPSISSRDIDEWKFPLPPVVEQQRIVDEIEKYFSIINTIENEEVALKDSVKKAKSKVLELALSGKLTSHTSHYGKNEETFSGAELGDVCKLCDGEKIAGKDYTNLDVKYLRGTKSGDMLHSGRFVPAGSLMILVDGENSGEVFTTPVDGYQGSTFKILDIDAKYCKEFILLLIQSNRKSLRENKVGSAIPHLNKKMFKEIVVPPFSYNEQCEIAQTVKDYFCVLDSIVG